MCKFIAHILIFQCCIVYSTCQVINLTPYTPELLSIQPNSQATIIVSNITNETTFVLIQAHSQFRNVTLSLHPKITTETSETGNNVGILVVVKEQTTLDIYLSSFQNVTVSVLVYVHLEGNVLTPVPGGCSLEFNMENDPNFHLAYSSDITDIRYQWAINSTKDSICENSPASNQMSYNLYVYYIEENELSEMALFEGLKKMITPDDIQKNGIKLKEVKYTSSTLPKIKLPSYIGQGTIYNLIVTHGDKMAAYVPMTTYSCDIENQDDKCHFVNTAGQVLITIVGIMGLFLCFLGHRFFQTANFLTSFCGFFVVFYLVLSITTNLSVIVIVVLTGILGAVAAILWLMVWWCLGQPVLSLLVPSLTAGYLFACILFYTPLGNLQYWSTRYNYGMGFTVCVLLLPVLILYWTKTLSILCCTFIGSFLTVLAVDVWITGGLKFIVINSFRHAYIVDYLDVLVTGPFETKDIILACVWALLLINGTGFQFYRERGRPHFPQCPRKTRRLRHLQNADQETNETRPERQMQDDSDERSPLIRPGVRGYYTINNGEQHEPVY